MAEPPALIAPVAASYPNWLTEPSPKRLDLPGRYGWLVILFLLCLVLRIWMAGKIASVCPDAVLYIDLAKSLQEGGIRSALVPMRLNTYPFVLAGLNRLGLDWEVAGKYWGVFVSSLVVLPLFGWVRRQFDDRIALVACFLYATHAEFITWSPETIRDPTFWFLFALSLYLLWRAIVEVRLGFYLAAGVVVALTLLTRFEGVFLAIPFGLWFAWRWWTLAQGRGRMVTGGLLCILFFPTLLFAVNHLWLHYPDPWDAFRSSPFEGVKPWLGKLLSLSTEDTAIRRSTPPAMTLWDTLYIFIPVLVKGLTPAFALLMLGGMWGWRRVWARRDHQPLFCLGLVVLGSVWIHLSRANCSCPRYLLPIVLVGSPFAALGLLGLTARLGRLLDHRPHVARWRWAVFSPVALVAALGVVDISCTDTTTRLGQARMGHWIRQEIGPSVFLLGYDGLTDVISYYAQAHFQVFPFWTDDGRIVQMVRKGRPDAIVMFSHEWARTTNSRTLLERVEKHGYQLINPSCLPPECHEMLLVVRRDKIPQMARRSADDTARLPRRQSHPL